jgi:hypothetical protein
VLYFLSIFENAFNDNSALYGVKGSFPVDKSVHSFLTKVGFYDVAFIANRNSKLKINKTPKHIFVYDNKTNVDEVERICKFIFRDNLSANPASHKLYETLVEMMENSESHAYIPNRKHLPYWYILAWNNKDDKCYEIAFLDTGTGIPATVRKSIPEQGSRIVRKNDAHLLKAAMKGGKSRSRTGKAYRNRGLPSILNIMKQDYFYGFELMSDQGSCAIADDKKARFENLPFTFNGTLAFWKVRRD